MSPMVWVPLSLFIAIIYAIGNVVASHLSDYGFNLRSVMSPGSLLANVIALAWIGYSKYSEPKDVPMSDDSTQCDLNSDSKKLSLRVLFYWFYDIYYFETLEVVGEDSEEGRNIVRTTRVRWNRVWITLVL